MTTELLTVRLNSVNDILALQEEEMVEKVSNVCCSFDISCLCVKFTVRSLYLCQKKVRKNYELNYTLIQHCVVVSFSVVHGNKKTVLIYVHYTFLCMNN